MAYRRRAEASPHFFDVPNESVYLVGPLAPAHPRLSLLPLRHSIQPNSSASHPDSACQTALGHLVVSAGGLVVLVAVVELGLLAPPSLPFSPSPRQPLAAPLALPLALAVAVPLPLRVRQAGHARLGERRTLRNCLRSPPTATATV